MLVVATDGACIPNPGPGGWAWVTEDGRSGSGEDRATTNNGMELRAVLEALNALEGPLLIQSDSQYVVNTFTTWRESRKGKGLLGKPKNADLIEAIDAQLQGREIKWEWVRGHSGHPLNEQADLLATAAADAFAAKQTAPETARRPFRPQSFPANFAGTCGNCATRFPVGAQIVKNSSGKYVHARGCPAK
jgi:ribonuclease HI